MEDATAVDVEELVLQMIEKLHARKVGAGQAQVVLYATVRDTLERDPLLLELGEVVDAYAETTPTVRSRIHSSHPENPVLGFASTLLKVHSILVKDPRRWCNSKVSEEEVCELYHKWFHYMEQSAKVDRDWECVNRTTSGRKDLWFDSYMLASTDDDRWLYYMKMCHHTFLSISNRLQMLSWRETFPSRPAVPIPTQLGATIYHLVHGANYETIAQDFGIEMCLVQRTIEICVDNLLLSLGEYLDWPRPKEVQKVISGFKEHWLLDDCRGVIGTTRINITPPKFNGSVTHIVALQGVCDSSGAFLNISCAHPGTLSDSEILRASNFFEKVSLGQYLKPLKMPNEGGARTRPYLLASRNYEPLPWLLVSKEDASDHDDFNYRTMMATSSIHRAFKDLKKDFTCLRSGIVCELAKAPAFLHVCCILHNFLYLKEVRPVRPSRSQLPSFSSSGCESDDEDSGDDWESEDEDDNTITTECRRANQQGFHSGPCSPCSV